MPPVNPYDLSSSITHNWRVKFKQNLDKNLHLSAFKRPALVPFGFKLARKRPYPCSAGRRQSVFSPLPRAKGSQLSLRVITYRPRVVEWCVKYGHRSHGALTQQQVN